MHNLQCFHCSEARVCAFQLVSLQQFTSFTCVKFAGINLDLMLQLVYKSVFVFMCKLLDWNGWVTESVCIPVVWFGFCADAIGSEEEGWCAGQCGGGACSTEKASRNRRCTDTLLVGIAGCYCHNQRRMSVQIHRAQGNISTANGYLNYGFFCLFTVSLLGWLPLDNLIPGFFTSWLFHPRTLDDLFTGLFALWLVCRLACSPLSSDDIGLMFCFILMYRKIYN